MATASPREAPVRGAIVAADAQDHVPTSPVDWAAIIAGGVLATAISFIMLTFGSAIGLGLASPYAGSGVSLMVFAIAAGLWLVWTQVTSFIAGGYLAGRMRRRLFNATPHEVEIRDGCHGLLVWALGALVGALLAASTASGAARTGAAVAGAAVQAAGTTAAQAASGGTASIDYLVDTLFRSDTPQPVDDSSRSAPEAVRILTAGIADGGVSADDKAYLGRLISARTGLAQPDAERRIDQVVARLQDAADAAKATADRARRTGVVVAFVTAASLLISAAAAWWAAGLGGRHRDDGTDFSMLIRWR